MPLDTTKLLLDHTSMERLTHKYTKTRQRRMTTMLRFILVVNLIDPVVASSGAFQTNFPTTRDTRRGMKLDGALQASLDRTPMDWTTRRTFGLTGLLGVTTSTSARAAVDVSFGVQAESMSLESGLLDSRVTENVLSPPPYGLEGPDIFYPSWLSGTWKVESTCTDVLAPCGITLFGGNVTYQSALKDVGSTLSYGSRFVTSGDITIADREYNVRSIAKAAMGSNSVVDIILATPNKFSCVLAPTGSPSLLKVDLITLLRRQENIGDNHFDCSEVVREIVSPVGQQSGPAGSSATILKEVETTSLYTYDPIMDVVRCRQRSAVFLLPSQQSPMAMKMFEYSRGRPIDVRFFDVVYTKG